MLLVRIALQRQKGKFAPAEPKSSYSKRRLALSQTVVEALRVLIAGPIWRTHLDLVFCLQDGSYFHPLTVSERDFPTVLKKSGLELDMRFHDMRHTSATLLLARGVNPKIVSEMLGHSDVSTTLRIYVHVTQRMQQPM